jgi:lipopolysaccharide export system protein LptA
MTHAAKPMRRLRPTLLVAIALGLPVCQASAERADRDKPTQIDADKQFGDDLKQIVIYTGNVVLTRGTLRITGARLEFRQDPEGYQYAVVTAAPGQLASFRQRRDPTRPGIEEHIEGTAERIEYDGKAETARFVNRANWKRLENGEMRDELTGSVITYDGRNSTYRAEGGDPSKGSGRVRTIIAPRNETPPTKGEPAPLEPARPQ